MPQRQTECLHPDALGLDVLPASEVLARLLASQIAAVSSVKLALGQIEVGAELMARTVLGSGRIAYVGAGSSALMANADGMELSGTYGIDPARVVLVMAGGIPVDANMPGDCEDDADAGHSAGAEFGAGDLVIAVSASGSTPFTLALLQAAKERMAMTIAIANNPDARIFAHSDVAIYLPTPPEIIAGSTRMGAASAQKVAMNIMSTMMGIRLGQVHDGMMVGLVADNAKLRDRACEMLHRIAGVERALAENSLALANYQVKPGVLVAMGASPALASNLLSETKGNLRAAMTRMRTMGNAYPDKTCNQGR